MVKFRGMREKQTKKIEVKREKRESYLIMFKYCQSGVSNGFSCNDVPNKASQKPYFDHAASSQTLLIACLFLEKESQVLTNSRNTPLSPFPPQPVTASLSPEAVSHCHCHTTGSSAAARLAVLVRK